MCIRDRFSGVKGLVVIVHKLFEVIRMSRSTQGMILLLLSVMSVLFLVSYAVIPTSATAIVQLQPNSVSSGDRVYVTANLARNASTVTLSYYADANKNGKDDDLSLIHISEPTRPY